MKTEEAIWQLLKQGETASLKELYNLFHNDLYNYGRKISPDHQLVEDAIQETFISIWKYRDTIKIPASAKQYLLKAFRNHLFQTFKERSKVAYTAESLHFSFEIGFDEKIIEGENAQMLSGRINNAISKLTNRQREIIYYRFYENLSFDEIAGMMDMQTRATYKLTSRALSALKDILDPDIFRVFLGLI